MSGAFKDKVVSELHRRFRFKKPNGAWMQEGECPECHKWKLFCSAEDPKVVVCGSANNCGYKESVREVLADLFDDWSNRVKPTQENPHATADEYLRTGRGLDITGLRGHFTQEYYKDHDTGHGSATVRFPLPGGGYWERLIDRPGRFGKRKAGFMPGAKVGGHCWAHPDDTFIELAQMDEIWIAEGIFDALALRQNFKRLEAGGRKTRATAVSAMSSNFWPEHFLSNLREALAGSRRQPQLVFAFDVGKAGVDAMREFTARARREHWDAGAAIASIDGEGEKRDWNDLLLLQASHKADDPKGPLSIAKLEEYRWNAEVTMAGSAQKKAELMHERLALASFDLRFKNRTYWASRSGGGDDDDGERKLIAREIANCTFRVLYRERDEVADETTYFLQIDFPGKIPTAKARFGHSTLADSGAFKKRLMAFAGTWSGNGDQLDRIVKNQPGLRKVVTPIKFTGYSPDHKAWVLGDIAVREGRVYSINRDKFFDFGKQAVKLRSDDRLLRIKYDPDNLRFDWLPHLWAAYGPRGVAALGFFMLSLFAEHVRHAPLWHSSLFFLEVTGLPGSGKTTLVTFLHKLLGRGGQNGHEGYDPNKVTGAALGRLLMRLSNLPEGLIEGRRDEEKKGQRQFDYNELLILFDGRNPRATGQKSDGYEIHEQPFLGALYLMQNERIDAHPAVLERLVSMNIGKERHSEANRASASKLAQWPVDELSGTIVHVARQEEPFLARFKDRFADHQANMGKRVNGLANDRIIKNHSQLAAAVECLPLLFPQIPAEWITETLQLVDELALDRQQSTGGDHPIVSDFWDKVQFLLDREATDAWEQGRSLNQHRKRDTLIAINLVDFESRCHSAGIKPPNMESLKKLLKGSKSHKFLHTAKVNNPAGQTRACWVFEQPHRPERII